MKLILNTVIMTLAIIFFGCECVVEADSDKIIRPTEFANILFVNASMDEDLSEIFVFTASQFIDRVDTIKNNWKKLIKDYRKVGIKVANKKNSIRLVNVLDTNELLYNGLLDVKKDSSYSFVVYGKNSNVQTILMPDYVADYNADNVYLRCYNTIPDSPEMNFFIITEGYSNEFTLRSAETTPIFALPNGTFTIKINSKDGVFTSVYEDIKFSQGKMNNFIIKGAFQSLDINYGIASGEFKETN